jgi:hypothetical protein
MKKLFWHIPVAGLILLLCCTSCAKDLSCYRDLIIGTWIEQSIDGMPRSGNNRNILTVGQEFNRTFLLYSYGLDGSWSIHSESAEYDISCRDLTLIQQGFLWEKYEIPRLNDSLLYLQPRSVNNDGLEVMVGEIIYKKVREDDPNAKYIQQLWQAQAHETLPAFRVQFNSNGTYSLYLEKVLGPEPEEPEDTEGPSLRKTPSVVWEEKTDENGKYKVYGPLLQLTFFNNSLWGVPELESAAQWDLRFVVTQEEGSETQVVEMFWESYVYDNGAPSLYSLRLLPVPKEEEGE